MKDWSLSEIRREDPPTPARIYALLRSTWRAGRSFSRSHGGSARFEVFARFPTHMYRLLVALLVLNLAQVTAGYACSMAGEVVQPVCCCDAAASRICSEPNSNCSTAEMVGSESAGCCSIVLRSGIGAAEQTATAMPNAPSLIQLATEAIPVLRRGDGITPLDARSLTYVTSPVYLLTGRLRR